MPNLRSDERSVLGSARTFGPKALSVQHYPEVSLLPGVPDEGDPAVLGHEGVPELVVGRSGRRLGKGRIEP